MQIQNSLINSALGRMDTIASRLAAAPAAADLPREMAGMSQSVHEVKIAAAVTRTCDDMLGSLIDMKA